MSRSPESRAYAIIGQIPAIRGRPFITLTYCQTLDGLIGQRGGLVALSCPESYIFTHCLRCSHQAIMVGIGTVKSDNPSLSTRLVTAGPQGSSITHPRPIIIDPHFETPIQSKFISRSPILLGIRENDKSSKLESKGACIVLIPVLDSGKMDMSFAMQLLYSKYGISSIMVEGGASVIAQFLTSYDRLFVTISPQFLSRGIRVAAPKGLISDAQYHIFGRDIVLESNIRMDTPAPLNVQTSQTAIIQNAYISFY